MRLLWLATVAILAVAGAAAGSLTYTDVAQDVSVDFQQAGEVHAQEDETGFPEIMGGGACFADLTGDGYPDLYLPSQRYNPENAATEGWIDDVAPVNRLYRNDGDGTFTDVTEGSGLDTRSWSYGCSAADYDADGDLDVYVTNFGGNELFENTGNGTFVNATDEAGVAGKGRCAPHRCMSTTSTWADHDEDGDLDLYVANYVDTDLEDTARGPEDHVSQRNFLFENQGDGTFAERGAEAGVVGPESKTQFGSKSLGASWFDANQDGLIDLYVTNDISVNDLYVNDGDGTFTERSSEALVADKGAGMGLTIQDYDQDGHQDLFFTHYDGDHNGFYRNRPDDVTFEDRSGEDDLSADLEDVGWGTRFSDLDRDGDLDLLAGNGHTIWNTGRYNQTTRLWTQERDAATPDHDREWVHQTNASGLADVEDKVTRGVAFADHDYDGDTDVVLANNANQSAQLLEASGATGSSLTVRLNQSGGNPHGIGATVTVTTSSTELTQVVRAGGSYLSQNSMGLDFGLRDHEAAEVTVEWPDGGTSTFQDVAADGVIRVDRAHDRYVRDTISPVSDLTVDATPRKGWYDEPVDVTITAQDRGVAVVSGVDRIRSAVGDQDLAPRTEHHLDHGVHEVRTSAVDEVGNAEPVESTLVRVDTRAPTQLHHAVDGAQGANGWHVSDPVDLVLGAEDDLSGVDRIEYRVDEAGWETYSGPVPLEEDGVHDVAFRAVDVAGNVGPSESFAVKLDATPPDVELAEPTSGAVYLGEDPLASTSLGPAYILSAPRTDGRLGAEVAVRGEARDETSGLAALDLAVSGQDPYPTRADSPATWTWDTRESASGVHAVEVTARDGAGNTATEPRNVVLASATDAGVDRTLETGPAAFLRHGHLAPDPP